jgi:hypothetical protein
MRQFARVVASPLAPRGSLFFGARPASRGAPPAGPWPTRKPTTSRAAWSSCLAESDLERWAHTTALCRAACRGWLHLSAPEDLARGGGRKKSLCKSSRQHSVKHPNAGRARTGQAPTKKIGMWAPSDDVIVAPNVEVVTDGEGDREAVPQQDEREERADWHVLPTELSSDVKPELQLSRRSFSLRSPRELSTRATVGQNLPRCRVQGAGKAASSRV